MGIRSTNLERKFAIDELLGNLTENGVLKTARVPFSSFASQLASTGVFVFGNMVYVQTRAQLLTITPTTETAGGVVLNDADATLNGYYSRVAAAWVKQRGFPDSVAVLTNIGGTANAITADTADGVDPSTMQAIILPSPPGTNSSATVTIAINGAAVQDIKAASGSNPAVGDIIAGVGTMFFRVGLEWRQLFCSATGATFDHQGTWSGVVTYTEAQVVTGSNGNWYQLKAPSSLNDNPVGSVTGNWLMILVGAAIADGAITEPKHATGGVSTRALADASVTEPKLDGALTLTLPKVCYSIAQLQAVDTTRYNVANLAVNGRDGMFTWVADASAALVSAAINSSAINDTTETITSVAHGLVTGQAVITTTAVNGLALNTLYYVIRVDADNFRLASSFANAKAGTAFNLTGTTAVTVKRHNDPLMGIYVTPTADLSGASGAWVRQHTSPYNVKWFGAAGNGSTDDTHTFQAAIFYAENASLRQVFVPAHSVSQYYKLGAGEILITKPIQLIGEHPMVTIGNQAAGLVSTQYLFNVDGSLFPNLEQVKFKNLSLRPDLGGTRCRGINLNRVAYPILEDVIITNATIGVNMTGNRGYASDFNRLRINSSSGQGFLIDGFTGGGQHNFNGCAFNGNATGLEITASSAVSGVNFNGCAWEGNAQGFIAQGTISGIGFYGCYAEKNTPVGGYTLGFIPSAANWQRGIVISGGYWETDNEAYPFLIGGAGTIRGIEIFGIEAEGYSTALVRYNGSGALGGQIRSNYLQNMTLVVSNGPFTRVAIENNENATGAVTA